ncbi:MAG: hypothetical protein K9G33_05565 [Sneathiella sp.]|nr:hypothetical protein [Sneathiella sp.]
MRKTFIQPKKRNKIAKALAAIKSFRQQISIVAVAMLLGALCILNVTMASETVVAHQQGQQQAYLAKLTAERTGNVIR